MKHSETLDRFSLVLMGLAIGFFFGGFVQALNLPSWIQAFGALIILAVSFAVTLRSISVREAEIAAEQINAGENLSEFDFEVVGTYEIKSNSGTSR